VPDRVRPVCLQNIRSLDDKDLQGLHTVIHHIKSAASNEFGAAFGPPRLNLGSSAYFFLRPRLFSWAAGIVDVFWLLFVDHTEVII